MKKNLLVLLLCLCLVLVAASGCGSAAPAAPADDTSSAGQVPSASEPAKEPEPEPEPVKDWFEEHGLVITPQGEFTFTTMTYDGNNNALSPIEAKSRVVVTETTDGVDDGYKKVTASFTTDYSAVYDVGGSGVWYWTSAFDRYTGTSFEFDPTLTVTDPGETNRKEGFATIVNGDDSYNVAIAFETISNYPVIDNNVTVTCPVDYDGVVFQIGYDDDKLMEEDTIDYSARFYTIDELPFFGDQYVYFSYTNT